MFKQIRNCFGKDPVNTGRQHELDVAKGFIIIFMALSHAIEILGWFFDPALSDGFFWHGFDMVIKGSAPIFMFCLGISLSYTRRQSAKDLLNRALMTAWYVVLLEIARTVIPCFIEWLIFRDFEALAYANEIVCVDILQFATMAFFAFALLKKLKVGFVPMLLISAVLSVAGQLLQGVATGSVVIDRVLGFFWNTNPTAFFPFFNWFIAPVIGYGLGKMWLRLTDKATFFRIVTPISLVITVAYYAAMMLTHEWYFFSGGDYCGIGLLDVLFMLVIFFLVVGGCYYLGRISTSLGRFFASMGARITSVFCIHWTIYCFLYLALVCIVGDGYVPLWTVPPVAAAVFVLSDLLSRLYKRMTAKKKS